MLFEYAVLFEDDDESKRLVINPTCVVADDDAAVRFIATQQLTKDGYDSPEGLEILVRSFVGQWTAVSPGNYGVPIADRR